MRAPGSAERHAGPRRRGVVALALLALLAGAARTEPAAEPAGGTRADAPPRLVLLIVVDQLRGDVLPAYAHRMGEGGFRRLLEEGLVYRAARHRFGVTATAPAHATLATGAPPAVHGIVGNEWLDPHTGERVNAVGGAAAGDDASGHDGAHGGGSPALLEAETLADVLAGATGAKARIYAVAGKDRSAILVAGRSGKAYWYDHGAGAYVTSDHYHSGPPPWLVAWNREAMAGVEDYVWRLIAPVSAYAFAQKDDQAWERGYKGLDRVFPHVLAESPEPATALRATPLADTLTAGLALRILELRELGRDAVPDLLMVGLSATDYVGHAYGPDSLEAEDNLLRLDRTVAELVSAAEEAAGKDGLLVVLTSDHGIPSAPEYLQELGGEAGRVDMPGLMDGLNAFLGARYDTEGRLARAFLNPWIYLDRALLDRLGLDPAEVESAAAGWLVPADGIGAVLTRSELARGDLPDTELVRRVRAGFHPRRSGHLYLVQRPGWHLYPDPDYHAVMHGSPWDYDAHVPLVLLGPGVPAGSVSRPVDTEDLAPTLARLLGIRAPSRATGAVLEEFRGR